jgi:hypothetical protein
MEKQQAEGGFRVMSSVEEICLACGINDQAYIDGCAEYDAQVVEQLRRLRAVFEGFGIELPAQGQGGEKGSSQARQLTPAEIASRVEIVRDMYLAANQVSVLELGALLIASHAVLDGFPVNGLLSSYISPLLDSGGNTFAASMVFAAIFHNLLLAGSTIRIDCSLLPGHFETWKGVKGLKDLRRPGERDMCLRRAGLVIGGGFGNITTGGGVAETAVVGAGGPRAVLGGAAVAGAAQVHRHVLHPVNLVMKKIGNLQTILDIAAGYEGVARALGSQAVPASGEGPMMQYLRVTSEDLVKPGRGAAGEFDSVAATKAARSAEKQRGVATPWANVPPMVRAYITLRYGAISDETFYALGLRPRLESTPEPFSPLCIYRSSHGIEGGLAAGTTSGEFTAPPISLDHAGVSFFIG